MFDKGRFEDMTATEIPATGLFGGAKSDALKTGVVLAKTSSIAFFDVCGYGTGGIDQLPGSSATTLISNEFLRIEPSQVG